jgi:hypothetical protein
MDAENDSSGAIWTPTRGVNSVRGYHIAVSCLQDLVCFPFLNMYSGAFDHIDELFARMKMPWYGRAGWYDHIRYDHFDMRIMRKVRAKHFV